MISPTDVSLSYTASVAAHASTITTLQTGPLVLKGISVSYNMDSTASSAGAGLVDIKLYDGSSEIMRICHAYDAQVSNCNFAYAFPANGIRVDGDLGLGVRESSGTGYTNLAATGIYVLYQQG